MKPIKLKRHKKDIQHTKARLGESLKKHMKKKVMHGQYIISVDRQRVSGRDTLLRLSR